MPIMRPNVVDCKVKCPKLCKVCFGKGSVKSFFGYIRVHPTLTPEIIMKIIYQNNNITNNETQDDNLNAYKTENGKTEFNLHEDSTITLELDELSYKEDKDTQLVDNDSKDIEAAAKDPNNKAKVTYEQPKTEDDLDNDENDYKRLRHENLAKHENEFQENINSRSVYENISETAKPELSNGRNSFRNGQNKSIHEQTDKNGKSMDGQDKAADTVSTVGDILNFSEIEVNDVLHKFVGAAFNSFRDRPRKRGPRRWSMVEYREDTKPEGELSRSQYSLVSCTDLTAGAIQLWMGLPEEVKYDPALAPFRQFYEKEHGKLDNKKSSGPLKQRLPSVNSAPHLNNNHQVVRDEPSGRDEKRPEKLEKLLEDHESIGPKKSLAQKAQHYVKMTLLLACWLFFTAAFLMYNEKEAVTRNSSVAPFEIKSYTIPSGALSKFSFLLELSGPFLSETAEMKMNSTGALAAKKMEVWLERIHERGDVIQTSDSWKLILQAEDDLDFSEGEFRSATLKLEPMAVGEWNTSSTIALRIRTTANTTTPFAMSYTANPLDLHTGVAYASILLFGLYVLIIFEIINRTMAAVLISTLALGTLSMVGERPSLPEIISWLDVETLLLLFSMMLLVAIMAETGMFDFLAVFTFEVTKGKLWPLITVLCTITAVLSTFLDNVTTVLLMTPVTIRLCEVMDLDPIPVLMSMVLFSNIGGTATPVGDPPNVIIASNKAVVQSGINFTNFTLHMTIGILLVCVQTYIQLRFIYRDATKLRLNEPRDIKDLRHQISIWRRAAESLPHMSRDEHVVRERLERKVKKLTAQLDTLVKESNKRACPKDTFRSTLAEMKEKYKIRDKPLLIKSTIAIGFVVTVFFLHSIPELNRVSLGWTALLGAILLLTLADREDLEPILLRVEWSTLLFFAALFVLMEALSKLGLIEFIGGLTENLILSVDEKARLAVAILLMLWVSGITSAFVDNIPLTTMMVRVVTSLGSNPTLNLPMAPLIWALSFGACLGGNGTLIGASANVVCAGVAEHHGYKFSFMQFFKIGFPVMIGHLIVASGYLMVCHCLFTWH